MVMSSISHILVSAAVLFRHLFNLHKDNIRISSFCLWPTRIRLPTRQNHTHTTGCCSCQRRMLLSCVSRYNVRPIWSSHCFWNFQCHYWNRRGFRKICLDDILMMMNSIRKRRYVRLFNTQICCWHEGWQQSRYHELSQERLLLVLARSIYVSSFPLQPQPVAWKGKVTKYEFKYPDPFPILEPDLGTCSQLNMMRGWPDNDYSPEEKQSIGLMNHRKLAHGKVTVNSIVNRGSVGVG